MTSFPLPTELWCINILYISWNPIRKAVHELPFIPFMCRKENVKRSQICWGICFLFFLELLLVQESEKSRSSLYSARLFSHCSSPTSSSVNHTPVHLCFCLFIFHNSFPVIRLPGQGLNHSTTRVWCKNHCVLKTFLPHSRGKAT